MGKNENPAEYGGLEEGTDSSSLQIECQQCCHHDVFRSA